jgi:hypothetical protein
MKDFQSKDDFRGVKLHPLLALPAAHFQIEFVLYHPE